MKTLRQANEENTRKWLEACRPRPNGIACPNCGHELDDVPGLILTTDTPQLKVICTNCGFKDHRVAP